MLYYMQDKQGGDLMTANCVYTVPEIAIILRVSVKTVYRLVKSGDISAIRVRGQIRITSTALNNYLGGGFHHGT